MAAASGTLIAAAFESSGYLAQSLLLDQLGTLLMALAFLMLIIAGARFAFEFFAGGSLASAFAMLLTPVLFLFLVSTTRVSGGAEWQFGDFRGDSRKVNEIVGQAVNARVSLVFDVYNGLVSSISQSIIGVLGADFTNDQVFYTNRQAMVNQILTAQIVNPGLLALIHEGLHGRCEQWLQAAQSIAVGNRYDQYRGTQEYNDALTNYSRWYTTPQTNLQIHSAGYDYLLTLLRSMQSYQQLDWNGRPTAAGPQVFVQNYCEGDPRTLSSFAVTPEVAVDQPLTCSQIWCWTQMGLHIEARQTIDVAMSRSVARSPVYESLPAATQDTLDAQILEAIARKLTNQPTAPITRSDLHQLIAGLLLRHELERDPRTSPYADVAENSGVQIKDFNAASDLTADQRREMQAQLNLPSSFEKIATDTYIAAAMMPYVQGFILHVLALSFPFFALLALLPRKISGLMLWFGLWAWAKSWDVGWALVMLVDKFLWNSVPANPGLSPSSEGSYSPISVLESAFDADPSYSLTTYYVLLSTLLFAVPSVSAQVFLRGGGQLASFVRSGIRSTSSRIAQWKLNPTSASQTHGGSVFDETALTRTGRSPYEYFTGDTNSAPPITNNSLPRGS